MLHRVGSSGVRKADILNGCYWVEPVFGNLRHNKRLNRFTLRGLNKVGTQWRLFCLVHNIEKLARCELQ